LEGAVGVDEGGGGGVEVGGVVGGDEMGHVLLIGGVFPEGKKCNRIAFVSNW